MKWLFLRNQFSGSNLILGNQKTEKDNISALFYHVAIKVTKQCWVLGEDMYYTVIRVKIVLGQA